VPHLCPNARNKGDLSIGLPRAQQALWRRRLARRRRSAVTYTYTCTTTFVKYRLSFLAFQGSVVRVRWTEAAVPSEACSISSSSIAPLDGILPVRWWVRTRTLVAAVCLCFSRPLHFHATEMRRLFAIPAAETVSWACTCCACLPHRSSACPPVLEGVVRRNPTCQNVGFHSVFTTKNIERFPPIRIFCQARQKNIRIASKIASKTPRLHRGSRAARAARDLRRLPAAPLPS
jgi:hypothetical protein